MLWNLLQTLTSNHFGRIQATALIFSTTSFRILSKFWRLYSTSMKIASKIHFFPKVWLSHLFWKFHARKLQAFGQLCNNICQEIFSIKYLNNTLPTRKNLCKWSLSQSAACSFCLQSETLQHVISSCRCYLEEGRYTWRHNSVLLYLANTLSSLNQCTVYADLPSFISPCLITGDSLRPDLLLLTEDSTLYIIELTLGFETNMQANSIRKANKCTTLIKDLSSTYSKVTFINLSMSALGVMGSSCDSFLSLLQDLHFDKLMQKRIVMKTINIAIRSSYYIFCQRNKPWNSPELLNI